MNLPAKCPNCQHLVSVPEFPGEGLLQCPCCEDQFDAAMLISVDAPTLRIVTPPSQPPVNPAQHPVVSAEELAVQDDASASVKVESSSQMPEVIDHPARQTQATSRARAGSRRQRGAKLELLKIALGGIAGIIIAQMILWWLPGDLRRDPFQVAPHVPGWLAFLTPTELRQPSTTASQRGDNGGPSSADSGDSWSQDDDNFEAQGANRPPTTDRPTIDRMQGATSESPMEPAQQSSPTTRLIDAPSYPGIDLRNLLGDVRVQLEQYDSPGMNREARRDQLRMLYQRLCEIGEVVTFVDMNDPEVGRLMQASEALLARIAKSPEQLELVGRAAVTWMNYPSRVTDGVAIAGEVIQIRPLDELYVSTIRFYARPDVTARLVSELNPITDVRQSYQVGSRILAFGAIINNPEANIQGFTGNGPVVWEGLHIVLASQQP